jgi:hypothetical protein
MGNRNAQVAIVAVLAAVVGFAVAALVLGDNSSTPADQTGAAVTDVQPQPTQTVVQPTGTDTTATTTQPDVVPVDDVPSVATCIEIWNSANNTTPRDFLQTLQAEQAVRVNVGASNQVPPKCLVTIIANDGNVYRFPEGGGKSFPYTPEPGRADLAQLTPQERKANALAEPDGTLTAR